MINNSVSYSHSDQNFTFLESFENLYFKQDSSTKPIIGKPQKLGSYQITENSTKTGRQACDFTYEKFTPIPRKKVRKIDEKVLDFSSNNRTRPPRHFETQKDLNYLFPVKYLKNQIRKEHQLRAFILLLRMMDIIRISNKVHPSNNEIHEIELPNVLNKLG